MLKTIDFYIIKKYLGTFFFTMMLITMIALVIDFPERIDKFLNGPMTLKEILFDYYLNFIPWINGLLWPLFALMAVIFFTSRMAKDTEFVAMLSAGTSYYRILVPYLIAGGIITVIHIYANNVIIPRSTKIKGEFENTYFWESQKKVLSDNVFFYLNPNSVAYFRYYRKRDTSALDFRLEDYKEGKLRQVLVADQIKLKKEPNIWTISDYYVRKLNGINETLIVSKGSAIDTVLNLYPNDFIHYDNLPLLLTTRQMKKYIEYEKRKGLSSATKLKVEIQRRNADPISIIFLTILGFAIAARKSREGLGWNLAIAVVAAVVFMERGQRRITVNYAQRQQGRRLYAAQQSHLPLKINMAGVIPAIFASSLLLFPASLGQWFGQSANPNMMQRVLQDISLTLSPGQPLYMALFAVLIIFFCYFYTALMFSPKDMAENLKKSSAFIPGIRPGDQTARYLDTVMGRLTLIGALYMTAVCLLPMILQVAFHVPFYLGGTSLLIVVVVVMDFMAQVQSHLMSHQYEALMKKANLKGYGPGGLIR